VAVGSKLNKYYLNSNRFHLVILFAATLVLSACSVTHRFTPEEALRNPQVVFDHAVLPARISGVVLEVKKSALDSLSADSSSALLHLREKPDSLAQLEKVNVHFDSAGGRVLRESNFLVGKSREGDSIILPFDSIISLQFGGIDRGLVLMTIPQALAAQDLVRAHPGKKVSQSKYPNWNVVAFDRQGAKIDTVTHRLNGVSRGGVPVSVGIADAVNVSYSVTPLQQIGRHPYRAVRVGVALVILGVLILGPTQHVL
jgi:hypothetical protein